MLTLAFSITAVSHQIPPVFVTRYVIRNIVKEGCLCSVYFYICPVIILLAALVGFIKSGLHVPRVKPAGVSNGVQWNF